LLAPCLSGASSAPMCKARLIACGGNLAYLFLPVSCKNECAKLAIAKMVLKKPQKCGRGLTGLQPAVIYFYAGLGWRGSVKVPTCNWVKRVIAFYRLPKEPEKASARKTKKTFSENKSPNVRSKVSEKFCLPRARINEEKLFCQDELSKGNVYGQIAPNVQSLASGGSLKGSRV